MTFWCLIVFVVYWKAFGTVFQFCSCQISDLLHADTQTFTATLRNTFTARQLGIFNRCSCVENIQPQWQVGHGNKGVSMLRQKLWIPTPRRLQLGTCNVCTPHGKGNAPLEATGHSQPPLEKREAQNTEVRTEYHSERNCHNHHVTTQWEWLTGLCI